MMDNFDPQHPRDETVLPTEPTGSGKPSQLLTTLKDWLRLTRPGQFVLTLADRHHKLIIITLVSLVTLEGLWAITTLLKKPAVSPKPPTHTATQVAPDPLKARFEVTLSANQTTVNQTVVATVTLTTKDHKTDGATAIIFYDPKMLRVNAVEPGKLYTTTIKPVINAQKGTITISSITDLTSYFTGTGTFATVTFTPISKGTTTVDLAFNAQTQASSLVAAQKQNVLGSVASATLEIR